MLAGAPRRSPFSRPTILFLTPRTDRLARAQPLCPLLARCLSHSRNAVSAVLKTTAVRIVSWNMGGLGRAEEKWCFVGLLRADIAVLQETRLPNELFGYSSRRYIKPAANRDDVVIVAPKGVTLCPLPETAHGQALGIEYEGRLIFGIRSYPQVKEYYPKALLRLIDSIAMVSTAASHVPTVITGDFNASLDQGPGRDWTPPFRRLHDLGFWDTFCLSNGCDENSLPCNLDHGKTFRNSRGAYRIDHLYVNSPMAKRFKRVSIIEDGWKLSDHCPVVADFD